MTIRSGEMVVAVGMEGRWTVRVFRDAAQSYRMETTPGDVADVEAPDLAALRDAADARDEQLEDLSGRGDWQAAVRKALAQLDPRPRARH